MKKKRKIARVQKKEGKGETCDHAKRKSDKSMVITSTHFGPSIHLTLSIISIHVRILI
jgi:hypothetical protein